MIANEKISVDDRLKDMYLETKNLEAGYQPLFFRLENSKDQEQLDHLLDSNPNITVFDEYNNQLEELVKSKTVKTKFDEATIQEAVIEYLGHEPSTKDGVWVYYPWSFRLVHILSEQDFVDLRTNRNLYKITHEEREILSKKIIGVVGLSVGNSIAITMAMERLFGEIRLADYDILELSNLNRIRTGVHNLGLSKVVSTAREIMEIDPYMNVICFNEGLSEENITGFLSNNGKVDILVEECDSLDIKILCRINARELKIPVVMDTSDKGMIDIERFDLEPDRPILHGMIKGIDVSQIKDLTAEEKIPIVLSMAGIDEISLRMKASMLEVEQTISSWPQLASSVVLGGGATTDVCRRIALDQFQTSGRYYVDIESIIGDTIDESIDKADEEEVDLNSDIDSFVFPESNGSNVAEGQNHISEDIASELVNAAILAPTGGNCQPWQWVYENNALHLFQDMNRSIAFLDYGNMGSYIGFGAATENLILKAHKLGLEVVLKEFPATDQKLIASFNFLNQTNQSEASKFEPHVCDTLEEVIDKRETNRKYGPRQSIERKKLDRLVKIARTVEGADLKIIDDESQMAQLGEIIASVDRILITHKEGHRDFIKEIRWSSEEAETTRDGIDIATVDLKPSELAGMKLAKNWSVVKYISYWKGGSAFERMSRKSVASASALGLITMPKYDAKSFFDGGRAIQRVWLNANQQEIAFQPLTPAVFLFARLIHGKGAGMTDQMKSELTELRNQFFELFSLQKDITEVFLFRLSIAETPEVKSYRRPLEDVFSYRA